jgi:ketosteroid isomerase-like protein
MKIAVTVLGACAMASISACGNEGSVAASATAEATQPAREEDLAAIAAFNERYLGAINDEDIAALSSLTTEGHVMLPPNRAPIVGKAANDALNGRTLAEFDIDETWTPIETVVSGDLAFQRGTYTTAARPKASGSGAEGREIKGSFLRIYQRQRNGEWRMTRDMFNTEPAQPAQGAQPAK